MAISQSIRAGRAYVELFADSSKLVRGLRLAESRLRRFGKNVQKLGMRMAGLGAAMLTPVMFATRTFKSFDDEMLAVKAVTGATGEQFDRLAEQAKELGRTTSFTAVQVASAMLELGRAGFAVDEIEKAIFPVLNLSRATRTDLAEATNYASVIMRGFGLEARDMVRVVDVLTATANNSAQTLEDLAQSMVYAVPVANEYGLTLEQTAKALGTLANYGIKGTMAGTQMRTIMLRLADPKVRKVLRDIGVAVADTSGKMRPLAEVLQEVGAATANMKDVDRLALLHEIFQKRAVAGGAKLSKEAFEKLNVAVDNAAGTAARTAKIMDSGLGGALRRMLSVAEGIQIAFGEALSKTLALVADLLALGGRRVIEWIGHHKALVVALTAFAATLLAVGIGLVGFGLTVKLLAFGLGGLLTVMNAFKVIMAGVAGAMVALSSPLGLILGGVAALAAGLIYTSGAAGRAVSWLGEKFSNLKSDAIGAWEGIMDAYASGDLGLAAKIAWLTVKMQWAKGINFIEKMWLNFKTSFLKTAYSAFYGALASWEFVQNSIVVGMIEASSASVKAWNVFVMWWKKAINWVAGALGKAFSTVMSLFSDSWDHEEFMSQMNKELRGDNEDAAKEMQARNKEVEDRRRAMREGAQSDHEDRLREIVDADSKATAKLDANHKRQLSRLGDELATARKEWQDSLKRAKDKRAEAERVADGSKGDNLIKKPTFGALESLRLAGAAAMGTFTGMAVSRMAAGGITQKLIDASEKTAENTSRMLTKMDESGTFS